MAEVEASIPENATTIVENSTTIPEKAETIPTIAQETIEAPAPKRGRGRPAGARDKAPRTKVRVEPIPAPKAAPRASQASTEPPAETHPVEPVEARPPSPEPPLPRALFRQTSAHLLNLRDVMNSQKRASVAERHTSCLHAWPVV